MGCIYKRGEIYWIKYYRHGQPMYESADSTLKTVAQDLLKKKEGEIVDGKIPSIKFSKVTLDDLAILLATDYEFRQRKSLERAQISVQHLKDFFGNFQVCRLATNRIKEYIQERQKQRAKNGTINRELAALKRMFSLGAKEDPPMVSHIPYVPMLKEARPRQGFLTSEQYQKLHDALPDYLKGVLAFAYQTGWRKGEITGLQWKNVTMKEKTITLEKGTTKNEEERTIYMDDVVYALMQKQLKSRMRNPRCPWVFHRYGKQIKDMRGAWKNACKKAGVENLLFHDLRRTAVRDMTRQGIHDSVAMKITGHKTRAVFDRYNIVSREDLKHAAMKRSQDGKIS